MILKRSIAATGANKVDCIGKTANDLAATVMDPMLAFRAEDRIAANPFKANATRVLACLI